MKQLIVETNSGAEKYQVGDSAEVQILDNGSLWCDDFKGTIIVYAVGQFTSAIIAPFDCEGECQRHCGECATRARQMQDEED